MPVSPEEQATLRATIAEERRRAGEQIDALRRGFTDIVEAAELTSTRCVKTRTLSVWWVITRKK